MRTRGIDKVKDDSNARPLRTCDPNLVSSGTQALSPFSPLQGENLVLLSLARATHLDAVSQAGGALKRQTGGLCVVRYKV